MSDYFDRVEGHLLDAVERHAQRRSSPVYRWLRGRRPGLLALVGVLILSGSAAGAVLVLGQRSRPLSGVVPPYDARGNLSVAGAHYEVEITPSLQAGTIGWCNLITFQGVRGLAGHTFGDGSCSTKVPAVGSPLFAAHSDQGEGLWYVLTAPQVAAVRVAGGPTVLTRSEAQLPYGYRAAVFEVRQLKFAHERPPQLTALGAGGRVIPGGAYGEPAPREQTRYLAHPGSQTGAQGACSIDAARDSSVRAEQELVVTRLLADPGIIGRAFLSCAELRLSLEGSHVLAALLLDARHPGARPAALPYVRPVPGAAGLYTGFSDGHARGALPSSAGPGFVARRLGDAWLVVANTSSEAQAIRALRALSVGPIRLRAAAGSPTAPGNAVCRIAVRPLAGLQETSQSAYLLNGGGRRLRTSGPASLTLCTQAEFYDRGWPLSAAVMYPTGRKGASPAPAGRSAIPGHPGVFAIPSAVVAGRAVAERVGSAWLEISGGKGIGQQLALLHQLHVGVVRSRAVEYDPAPQVLLGAP